MSSCMVQDKLITQGIGTKIQTTLHTFASVQCSSQEINLILEYSQNDAKSSHIVYETLFFLIVDAHSFLFDCKHYSSNRY